MTSWIFGLCFRLTPCIIALLLFVIFVLPYLGSGPNWDLVSAKTITLCEKNWWTNMLYIQNLVNVDEIVINFIFSNHFMCVEF